MGANTVVAVVALALLLLSFTPSTSGELSTPSWSTIQAESEKSTAWECVDVTAMSVQPNWQDLGSNMFDRHELWWGFILPDGQWKEKHLFRIESTKDGCSETIQAGCETDLAVLMGNKTCPGQEAVATGPWKFKSNVISLRPNNDWCSDETQTVYVTIPGHPEEERLLQGLCAEVRVVDPQVSIKLENLTVDVMGNLNIADLPDIPRPAGPQTWRGVATRLLVMANAINQLYVQHAIAQQMGEFEELNSMQELAQSMGDDVNDVIATLYQTALQGERGELNNATLAAVTYEKAVRWLQWFIAFTDEVDACLCCTQKPPFTVEQNLRHLCKVAYTLGGTDKDGKAWQALKATWGALYNALSSVGGYMFGIAKDMFQGERLNVDPLVEGFNPTPGVNAQVCAFACSYRTTSDKDFRYSHVRQVPGWAFSIPYLAPEDIIQAASRAVGFVQ